ncbi:fatty acid desaturase [Tateyamaria omphalii]|uniref:Fatty acid desaturase n=1 Tax=Tateyamaria omphalii TaxID=299262 RepID=A0A1P8MV77_9RHOB|nr:fatty acid desaturase [Tateyamaria omphalii]APX11921.1 fatty acid desaturase [Tateyamaria omphalii]
MPARRSSRRLPFDRPSQVEWVTLGLWAACMGLWAGALVWGTGPVAWAVLVFALVLHASLSHEVLHGHPFPSRAASEALVVVNPGLFIPYLRFRDTHLAHHQDANLTDPYDDPETNYIDPAVWRRMPWVMRAVLRVNNTLAGRMLVGPLVAQVGFMAADWRAIRAGDGQVLRGWVLHVPGVVAVLGVVSLSAMPLWAYLTACYAALSVLKIRTFLEHQAHERARGRTVIIEDRGLLAFLFLNNNFHVVHHMHPRVPWYRLPALYRAHRDRYLKSNEGYRYGSYAEVFARHFLRAKDPVPHPLWSSDR